MQAGLWSAEEDRTLWEMVRKETPAQLGARLGRSVHSVKARLARLRVPGVRAAWPWSPELDAILLGAAPGVHVAELVQLTGRSWTSVWHRCRKLGKTFYSRRVWTGAELEQLRREVNLFVPEDLAARLGRTLRAVSSKAIELGLVVPNLHAHPERRSSFVRAFREILTRPACEKPTRPVRHVTHKKEVSRLAWCPVCSSPVVNTPAGWSAHWQRVGCNRRPVASMLAISGEERRPA